jgi:hypothetical protein
MFQVLVPSAGIRGFLDASEYGTWLKHFQSHPDENRHNVKHLLLAGQVWHLRKYTVNIQLMDTHLAEIYLITGAL